MHSVQRKSMLFMQINADLYSFQCCLLFSIIYTSSTSISNNNLLCDGIDDFEQTHMHYICVVLCRHRPDRIPFLRESNVNKPASFNLTLLRPLNAEGSRSRHLSISITQMAQ